MNAKEELQSISDQVEALEERRRQIYQASLEAPESEKVCEDTFASMLAEPSPFKKWENVKDRTFHALNVHGESLRSGDLSGQLVAVRPCAKDCEGKTFLGIGLGRLALSFSVSFNEKTGVLSVGPSFHNPAMWVPALGRVVYGCGSWWSPIKTEEQLRAITDEDIDSVWYVQALKSLSGTRPATSEVSDG